MTTQWRFARSFQKRKLQPKFPAASFAEAADMQTTSCERAPTINLLKKVFGEMPERDI